MAVSQNIKTQLYGEGESWCSVLLNPAIIRSLLRIISSYLRAHNLDLKFVMKRTVLGTAYKRISAVKSEQAYVKTRLIKRERREDWKDCLQEDKSLSP